MISAAKAGEARAEAAVADVAEWCGVGIRAIVNLFNPEIVVLGGTLAQVWRAAEERIRVAMDSAWRKTSPQDNPLLRQMRDQVAEAEQRLERAKAAGDARRIKEAEQALASKKQFLALAEQAS